MNEWREEERIRKKNYKGRLEVQRRIRVVRKDFIRSEKPRGVTWEGERKMKGAGALQGGERFRKKYGKGQEVV